MTGESAAESASFRLAHGISAQRVVHRGETSFVYVDDVSGQYFAMDHNTHVVLEAMGRGKSLAEALRVPGVNAPAFLRVLPQLVAAGLMQGAAASSVMPTRKPPIESRIFFYRREFVDISGCVNSLRGIGRAMFSRVGFALWLGLILVAVTGIAAHVSDLSAAAQRVLSPSPAQIAWMALAFWVIKILHELGHGLALAHVLEVEGRAVPPLRAGVGVFFLMPYPFTNASATWLVESKWRRALVGVAGMYVEGFIAAIAAIVWVNVGDGLVRDALFDIMVVAGVSTVLFNMNPLLRMDGYFIVTDILEMPNLSTRAAMASRASGVWLLTGRGGLPREEWGAQVYWLASYAYRWITFVAILILAFHYDERAGLVVLAVTLSTLVLRPLLAVATAVRAEIRRPAPGSPVATTGSLVATARMTAVAGVLLAAMIVPFENGLVVEGRSENPKLKNIYAETPGVVNLTSPAVAGAAHVVARVDNPELSHREAAASAELELAKLAWRQSLAADPERQGAQSERLAAAAKALDEVREEKKRAIVEVGPREAWYPDPRAHFAGAWTTPLQRRVLGVVLPEAEPLLKAEIAQDFADFGEGLAGRRAVVRVIGEPQRMFNAHVVSVLEVARQSAVDGQEPKRVFEVTLSPESQEPLADVLRLEGKRFEVRIERPWLSIGARVWDWLGRLAQKRFAARVDA